MAVETDTASPSATPTVAAERYVATNRFRVKQGRGAAFEKRWAERKSRLGMLDGFRFFCMLRLTGEWDGEAPNYISCTVWEEEAQFDAWKKGDAFKEAHGGGTIGGVASMVLATMQNTKGKPKVALWDGLLPVSVVPPAPTPGGWREIEADGKAMLDGEVYVAMNRFSVLPGMESGFEQRFASRESTLASRDGFQGFLLLRRDGAPDDGFTHSTLSVWRDKAAFEAWRGSEDRAGKPKPGGGGGAGGADGEGGPPKGPPQMFAKPPEPSFYEGILVLESARGI